ncbi:MAG: phytanoyl-CoA dioxygenase family protein [Williamsia herbipolensis]|uniref:phytanoyl-CoA dioxygenase family protein n=1 Tax=uncultured Williamsia sp. TaxID=259311 RepID=UPI0019F892F1|nr:phytanoyl-CoA dioxygenase family protein [uncultured Williamsia sp.]MBE7159808.1 phytanoyl-CoA dioxygenase family protein [Williamsia herbipolensis]
MTLSDTDIEAFVRDGFVVLRGAVDRTTIDRCRDELWDAIPESPDDPSTWTEPVRWTNSPMTPAFARAAAAPALGEAYDALIGPGRWIQRVELGTVPIRFPVGRDSNDTGWHFDASFPAPDGSGYRVSVSSRDRGLLALFLISDVDEDDAPTRIRIGSHADVPRFLEPYDEDGTDMFTVCAEMARAGVLDDPARHETLATGRAGDVFLCHPFLVHAAQVNRRGRPRFMSQPGIMLREQFDLAQPTSPVERAIVDALR